MRTSYRIRFKLQPESNNAENLKWLTAKSLSITHPTGATCTDSKEFLQLDVPANCTQKMNYLPTSITTFDINHLQCSTPTRVLLFPLLSQYTSKSAYLTFCYLPSLLSLFARSYSHRLLPYFYSARFLWQGKF